MGNVYKLRPATIGMFLRRVERLVCYRCGVELSADEWVFAKRAQGDCTALKEQYKNWLKNIPKVYHLACAKEVNLIV